MGKPYEDAYQLIENMAQNHILWGGERTTTEKPTTKTGMYEVNGIDHVNAKVDALTQKIENLTITPTAVVAAVAPNCELCGTPGHTNVECQLLAGYHKRSPASQQAPRKSNFKFMMENFMDTQVQQNKDFTNQNAHTSELMKQMWSKLRVMDTHNKMLEIQISQVSQQQAAIAAPTGTFPGQPQPNPKCHANAITLRSGTELDGPANPRLQNPAMYQNSGKVTETITTNDQPEEQKDKGEEDKNEEAIEKEKTYVPPPPYKPPIPYP
ncbi:hypothetical protein KIW84_043384 [Lathyrus oleraceus]|uniref:Uncharacterized protein n=1 Tax=Pisum sativum TaxID=3888 RepID=A0A9D4XDP9_PEA|nr:hypothetical protein KIW84_043384 [Pisum sativum]